MNGGEGTFAKVPPPRLSLKILILWNNGYSLCMESVHRLCLFFLFPKVPFLLKFLQKEAGEGDCG